MPGDLAAAIRYYEAVDWRRSSLSADDTVSFLRDGTVVHGLFGRDLLAGDCTADGVRASRVSDEAWAAGSG